MIASVELALREIGIREDYTDPRIIAGEASLEDAPDFIRDADLTLSERIYLNECAADLPVNSCSK